MDALILIAVAILGVAAGAFVNALADDLPPDAEGQRHSLRIPHYPDGTPRPPVAWSGLLAFLTGNRASPGGAKLSWRHPIAEVATAILMVVAVLVARDLPGVGAPQIIFWLIYMAGFVLITVIDIEHKLILFIVINPLVVIALLDALLTPKLAPPDLTSAIIGGIAGFAVFFLLYNGGFLFTYVMGKLQGREIREVAFGYGDVMMAGLSGVILGWERLIFALFITVFLGAFGAIAYLFSRRFLGKRYSAYTALPYGPYIVLGTLIMLLFAHYFGAAVAVR